MQFTVQMSKLNSLGKTYRKRIFVVELKTSLALLLRTNCLREFTVTLFTQEHRCKLEKCQENFTNSISIPFRGSDRTLIHIMLKETGIRDPAVNGSERHAFLKNQPIQNIILDLIPI